MMILHIEILLLMPSFCPRTTDAFWKGWVRLKLYSLHEKTPNKLTDSIEQQFNQIFQYFLSCFL